MIEQDRPVIGYIMMGASAGMETYLHRQLPPQTDMVTTRVPFHKVTYPGLLEMIEKMPEAACVLAEARPNVIAVLSFTGSCIRGDAIVNTIQQCTGVPTVVPALECVSILEDLGARRVALVSPFESELQLLERLFFREHGIEVVQTVQVDSAQRTDPYSISLIDYDDMAEKIRKADLSGVDAVIVDLPSFQMEPQVCAALRPWRHLPVLSILQIMLWATYEKVGAPRDRLYLSQFLKP